MSWQDIVHSSAWRESVRKRVRRTGARVELVDPDGLFLCDVPCDDVQVRMMGESSEVWGGAVNLAGKHLIPLRASDLLNPLVGNRLRVWWRVRNEDTLAWMEVPVCTLHPEDPAIGDSGTLRCTMDALDPLAEAKRGGYRGGNIELGGMLVGDALARIFATAAPRLPLRVGPSTVHLPEVYNVGDQPPADDWTKIAAMEGWRVRTTREGVIEAAGLDLSAEPVESWQYGDRGNRVLDIQRKIQTSNVANAVTVVGTNTELAAPIRVTVVDDDPGSPTYIGRYGPYGPTIYSDSVTTEEAARNMAKAELGLLRRPLDTVELLIPARPDLDYFTPIALGFPSSGVVGDYRVSGWDWTASRDPRSMKLTMMAKGVNW